MYMIVSVFSLLLLIYFHHYDEENKIKITPKVLCVILLSSYILTTLLKVDLINGLKFFYYSCFIICNITACIIDFQTKFVYDILQVPVIVIGACFAIYNVNDCGIGMSLFLFALMQGILFKKMYGAADVLFFLNSALLLTTLGYQLKDFLIMMLLSYLLLAIVQIKKRNVSRKGNLIEPVAMFPYILIALAIFLII